MADQTITLDQFSTVINKALKPVTVRLDRIENKVDNLETRFDGLETRFDNLEEKVHSMDEKLTEVKIDLGVIKEDYIGQVEEIRAHVGIPSLIKHKAI